MLKPFWLVWREDGKPPTRRHPTESEANSEAQRLAKAEPDVRFVVLQAKTSYRASLSMDAEMHATPEGLAKALAAIPPLEAFDPNRCKPGPIQWPTGSSPMILPGRPATWSPPSEPGRPYDCPPQVVVGRSPPA